MLNLIHKELKDLYAMLPEMDLTADVQLTRDIMKPPPGYFSKDNSVEIYDAVISGNSNMPDLKVRIYRPVARTCKLPGILYLHGGGFLFGAPNLNDPDCQKYVLELNCVVVSPYYRLAPENVYPAALDDCYAALKWMSVSADDLGIDNNRLAIMGESAGGGLAAAIALMARDQGGPKICFQTLIYPMLDDRNVTMSSHEIIDGKIWNRTSNINAWNMYLGTSISNREISYYAAPARANDLSALPASYILVGELDVFRDEVVNYATRLMQSSVSAELHVYPGCFHGFISYNPNAEICKRASAEYIRAMAAAFALDDHL